MYLNIIFVEVTKYLYFIKYLDRSGHEQGFSPFLQLPIASQIFCVSLIALFVENASQVIWYKIPVQITIMKQNAIP